MFEDALQKSVGFKTNFKSVFILLSFLYLDLSIINSIVVSKINHKRETTNGIVNCILLDGDVPISPPYDVYNRSIYVLQRVYFNVSDFNNRNQFLTATCKLLKS